MPKLLLVDDEPGQLIGFSKMLRRLRPSYQVCSARNGLEALTLMDDHLFDIVFTDIRMPFMDGLELLEKLHPDKRPKVIVLSGYDYFEYARKALTFRAFDYLLKPIDLSKLQEVLLRVETAIDQEKSVQQKHAEISEKLLEMKPVYRNRMLQEWISGTLPSDKRKDVSEILSIEGAGTICVTRVYGTRSIDVLKPVIEDVRQTVETLLGNEGDCCSFVSGWRPDEMITVLGGNFDEQRIAALYRGVEAACPAGIAIAVGVSNRVEDVVGLAPLHVQEACFALQQKFFEMDSIVFSYQQSKLDSSYLPFVQKKEEGMLLDAVRNGKMDTFNPLLTALCARICRIHYPLPERIRSMFKILLTKLAEEIEYLCNRDAHRMFINEIDRSLDDAQNIRQLIAASVDLLVQVVEAIAKRKKSRKDMAVHQCIDYINAHYMEDLSLEKTAAMFKMSAGYFSQYFKSNTDVNFTAYLNHVRMLKAKEILEEEDVKVYEIAAKVGYQDVKYFNRVFKKEYGATPEEYRKAARTSKWE